MTTRAEARPGYRRRIHIEPRDGAVLAMLEDDVHRMAVTLRHDGRKVIAVEPAGDRLPWDVCAGALAKLVETFAGAPLAEVTARREKKANCTHLHDLAVLGAAHAHEREVLVYDVLASDPVAGERILEIRRNGETVFEWIEREDRLFAPEALRGLTLKTLRDWIATLPDESQREAARLLQWGAMIAHTRTIPFESQANALALSPACYTLQPERAVRATRNRESRDFSDGTHVLLAGFGERMIAALGRDR